MTNQTGTLAMAAATDRRAEIVAAMSRVPLRRPNRRRVAVVTVLSLAIVGYAVWPYLAFDPEMVRVGLRAGVPWHLPILLAHIFGGTVALVTGPLQFVRRIRRVPRLHRYLGRAYLFAGVFPASLAGIVVAWLSTAGPVAWVGFTIGDVAWFVTALVAYRNARARRYRDHARWMIRGFALTFSAVTFRAWLGLMILVQLPWLGSLYGGEFDALFHTAYITAACLGFIPNLLAVEIYLRRRASRRPTVPAGGRPASDDDHEPAGRSLDLDVRVVRREVEPLDSGRVDA